MNWISVKEKLPGSGRTVLVLDIHGDAALAMYRPEHKSWWVQPYYGARFVTDGTDGLIAYWCEIKEPES